ncbi:MAG: amidohydrolase family protein [Oscillibacter sp.]|nr:amidohydrolase family protein [Oscillibacter sp.]
MIVDIHTHTFPDKIAAGTISHLQQASRTFAFSDGTNAALRASMERAGVDCSVVLPVATNPQQVCRVNDSAVKVNRLGAETGIYSFGCIHPDMPGAAQELDRIAALGLKGIKLHPAYQKTHFDDPKYLRILDRCGQLGLVVLTHAGVDIGLPDPIYCAPQQVLHAIREVGPVKLILAHMGGWRQWDEVEALLTDAPVYLDTAFAFGPITPMEGAQFTPEELQMMGEEQFLRFVKRFGPQRLLFGTDSPWGDQSADVERIRALPLSETEKSAILGGNAQTLLRL